MLSTRSPAYDARIAEYICAFSGGGTLHLLGKSERKDLNHIVKRCKKDSITSLLFIASLLGTKKSELIIQQLKEAGLENLLVTGDVCTAYLKNLCENLNIKLWNCYGPTEATFGISKRLVNWNSLYNSMVPIAMPYGSEIKVHIIDGEICIESAYLTPGYLNASHNEKAFKQFRTLEGEFVRVFRTGDLGQIIENSETLEKFILYEGRISEHSHCKINGVKVNPLYIEQVLLEYNDINSNSELQVSVVIKNIEDKFKPFAYIVCNQNLNKQHFLEYLKQSLKAEEIPVVIKLENLPRLGSSDKINKFLLKNRNDTTNENFFLTTQTLTPANELENSLANILYQMGYSNFSQDTDFIALGIDSIIMPILINKIQTECEPGFTDSHYQQLFIIYQKYSANY